MLTDMGIIHKHINENFRCIIFDKIRHYYASWYLLKTLNVNILCSLERGSVWASLGTLPLRIRIIFLQYQQKRHTWFACITKENSAVSRIWIRQSVVLPFLTHWGRVTHICVSKLTIIGSDNGLAPGRRQAIIWINARILLIRTSGMNFSEILIEIQKFWLKKIRLKISSGKWRQFCLDLNVLSTLPAKILRPLASMSITWQASITKCDISPTKYHRMLKLCLIVCKRII